MLATVVLAAGLVTVAVRRTAGSTPAPRQAGPTGAATRSSDATPTTGPSKVGPPPSPDEPAYITRIKGQVAELRGLAWKSPLAVEVVSRDELARRFRAGNERDTRPERVAGDGDTFRILHLIPSDLDYARTLDDLSGLVLGFYDPKTKELVVGAEGAGSGDVDPAAEVTLAHELDHALTDQWYDFGTATQALDDADRQEELDAFTALIEGDAKLLESRFEERFLSEEDQLAVALGGLVGGNTDTVTKLVDTPRFLIDRLYFPYTDGLAFARAQADTNPDPNAGVDGSFRRPPTSTEQILHPDAYAAGQGWRPPDLVDVAGATGCERRRRGSLGEFKMAEVLGSELSLDAAKAGAAGGNGDVFEAVRCGSGLGLVERWQADSEAAGARLDQALTDWARGWSRGGAAVGGRFSGPGGTGRIVRNGSRVDLVLGTDASIADRLVSAAVG